MEAMISVTILTKNSEATLHAVLQSVKTFDEVIILDTGSTDNTLEIAKEFSNCRIYKSPFIGFGTLHNLASSYAAHDWILSLDSDEVLSKELIDEMTKIKLDPHRIYSIPFNNYYNGKHIKWCGWYPDRHIRLYNKLNTSFTSDYVHESIMKKNLLETSLKNPIYHYSYRSISDFLKKMDSYSDLFAKQNQYKKKSSLSKALLHGIYAFIKSYFIQRGFLGGSEGFLISLYNSQVSFYKYVKLMELNHAPNSSLSPSGER